MRKLLGSPALVRSLTGVEREVALAGYEGAVRGLFLAAAGVGLCMAFLQAGTGWRAPESTVKDVEGRRDGEEDGLVEEARGD